jgi:hypothetical protein
MEKGMGTGGSSCSGGAGDGDSLAWRGVLPSGVDLGEHVANFEAVLDPGEFEGITLSRGGSQTQSLDATLLHLWIFDHRKVDDGAKVQELVGDHWSARLNPQVWAFNFHERGFRFFPCLLVVPAASNQGSQSTGKQKASAGDDREDQEALPSAGDGLQRSYKGARDKKSGDAGYKVQSWFAE